MTVILSKPTAASATEMTPIIGDKTEPGKIRLLSALFHPSAWSSWNSRFSEMTKNDFPLLEGRIKGRKFVSQ